MDDFEIIITDRFEESLLEIAIMIAQNFGKDVMEESITMIKEHYLLLSNPDIGTNKFPILTRKGYKVLVIPHNYVVYSVNYKEKIVTLELIIDDRQELYSVLERYSLL